MLQFTASQTGESAKLPTGESFEISLPENPATGFRWKFTATGEPVSTMTGEDFRPSTGVGGQGIHCWRFEPHRPAESEIEMVLRRSWGAPAEPEQILYSAGGRARDYDSFRIRIVQKVICEVRRGQVSIGGMVK